MRGLREDSGDKDRRYRTLDEQFKGRRVAAPFGLWCIAVGFFFTAVIAGLVLGLVFGLRSAQDEETLPLLPNCTCNDTVANFTGIILAPDALFGGNAIGYRFDTNRLYHVAGLFGDNDPGVRTISTIDPDTLSVTEFLDFPGCIERWNGDNPKNGNANPYGFNWIPSLQKFYFLGNGPKELYEISSTFDSCNVSDAFTLSVFPQTPHPRGLTITQDGTVYAVRTPSDGFYPFLLRLNITSQTAYETNPEFTQPYPPTLLVSPLGTISSLNAVSAHPVTDELYVSFTIGSPNTPNYLGIVSFINSTYANLLPTCYVPAIRISAMAFDDQNRLWIVEGNNGAHPNGLYVLQLPPCAL